MSIKDDQEEEIPPRSPEPNPQIQRPEPPPTEAPQGRWFGWLRAKIAAYWLIPSIGIALAQFFYSYKPRVLIEQNISFDAQNPFNTSYSVTNTGPFPLSYVEFTCIVRAGNRTWTRQTNWLQIGNGAPLGQPEIDQLDSWQTATRDCQGPSLLGPGKIDLSSLRIDVGVTYYWPLVHIPGCTTRHFSTRPRVGGFVLVPDVEGPPPDTEHLCQPTHS